MTVIRTGCSTGRKPGAGDGLSRSRHHQRTENHSVWALISIVPFVVAVLRYAVDVDGGNAGEPEDIALRDRILQILSVSWVACLALSVSL